MTRQSCGLNCFVNNSKSSGKTSSGEILESQQEVNCGAEGDNAGAADWETRHAETSSPAAAAH